jgi:hypothetical protein
MAVSPPSGSCTIVARTSMRASPQSRSLCSRRSPTMAIFLWGTSGFPFLTMINAAAAPQALTLAFGLPPAKEEGAAVSARSKLSPFSPSPRRLAGTFAVVTASGGCRLTTMRHPRPAADLPAVHLLLVGICSGCLGWRHTLAVPYHPALYILEMTHKGLFGECPEQFPVHSVSSAGANRAPAHSRISGSPSHSLDRRRSHLPGHPHGLVFRWLRIEQRNQPYRPLRLQQERARNAAPPWSKSSGKPV